MDNYYLSKKDDKWKLTKQGQKHAIKVAETKEELLKFSTSYVKEKEGSLKIKKQDGQFQEERTYPRSKDPKKTKG